MGYGSLQGYGKYSFLCAYVQYQKYNYRDPPQQSSIMSTIDRQSPNLYEEGSSTLELLKVTWELFSYDRLK